MWFQFESLCFEERYQVIAPEDSMEEYINKIISSALASHLAPETQSYWNDKSFELIFVYFSVNFPKFP